MKVVRFLALAALLVGCTVNAPNATINASGSVGDVNMGRAVGAPVSMVEDLDFRFEMPPGWVFASLPEAIEGEELLVSMSKETPSGQIRAFVSKRDPEPLAVIEDRARTTAGFEIEDVTRPNVAGRSASRIVEAYYVNGVKRQQIEVFIDRGNATYLVSMTFPVHVAGDPDVNSDLFAALNSWAWKTEPPATGPLAPAESSTTAPQPEPSSGRVFTPPPSTTPPAAATEIQTINISGTGKKASDLFRLEAGLSIFRFSHTGSSNFAVWLLDGSGKRVDLLANVIGDANGAQAVKIEAAGDHLFDVAADGAWSVKVEQPRPTTAAAAGTYTGTSASVAGPFQAPGGLVRFKMKHAGTGNFAVWLLEKDGSRVELLANEIGTFEGSKALGVDAGIYFLNVSADGEWSVAVE